MKGSLLKASTAGTVATSCQGHRRLVSTQKTALQGRAWGSLPAGASCSKGRVSMLTHASLLTLASHRLVTKLLNHAL